MVQWGVSVPYTGNTGTARTWIMADGAGGAIAVWANNTWAPAVDASIYAEHFNAAGTALWGWLLVCGGASSLTPVSMTSDGVGGAILAWEDGRLSGGTAWPDSIVDLYAQRVTSSGGIAPGWPADGLPLCTASNAQKTPSVLSDGAIGAIVVWTDWRSSTPQLYAAKITSDGTVPTLLSLVSADAEPNHVHLRWFSEAPSIPGLVLYRQRGGEGWHQVGTLTVNGTGEMIFDDFDVSPGVRYGYRLGVPEAGTERYLGEVWVDVPADLRLSLEAPRPNPTSGALVVSFTLPMSAPAALDVLDITGRRISHTELGSLGPGRHLLTLERGNALPAGVYSILLTQAGHSLVTKATVVR